MKEPNQPNSLFVWQSLGDIANGRPNLGPMTDVAVYRLMQYALRDVLVTRYGPEVAGDILTEAGRLAGSAFCRNLLDSSLEFNAFMATLQERLRDYNIGIMRMEKADLERMEITLTISEDLDCSGLPVTNETSCGYDEGFIAGIMKVYTGKDFVVRETDCWSMGERTCRFSLRPDEQG